jgi:hypothetical protein
LPCWGHVNLDGRLVYLGPDGDWHTNENVQMAVEAQVALLESRGARVLVVGVPEIPGIENPGIDDALAAGVSPYALQMNAKPFERVDVGRERLRKDERLRLFVAAKLREVEELPATGNCRWRTAGVRRSGTGSTITGRCEVRSYAPNKCLEGYEPRSKRTPGPPQAAPDRLSTCVCSKQYKMER